MWQIVCEVLVYAGADHFYWLSWKCFLNILASLLRASWMVYEMFAHSVLKQNLWVTRIESIFNISL